MRINTNLNFLTAHEVVTSTQKKISSSVEKLGTGLAINKAADNASGISISDKLRTQASSISQGISNANNAAALIQISDKAMSEQSNILDIVKQKLIQASTDTTTDAGREAIRKDVGKLLKHFDIIARETNYNGITLLQKNSSEDASKQDILTFQLGEDNQFDITLEATNASNTAHLGDASDTLNMNEDIVSTAGGGTKDNNLGQSSSQRIKTTSEVILSAIDISNTAEEIAKAGMDISLNGYVGNLRAENNEFKVDFRDESKLVQDAVTSLIANDIWSSEFDSQGRVILSSGDTMDLSNYSVFDNVENLRITGNQDSVGSHQLSVNSDSNINSSFNVINNSIIDGKSNLSNINMNVTDTNATGGRLLLDLKDTTKDNFTKESANSYIQTVNIALEHINSIRANFGTSQNQIQSSLRNIETIKTSILSAKSAISDVDFSLESVSFNKQNIIVQSGTYVMSQANARQNTVKKLFL